MEAIRAPIDSPFTTDELQFLTSPAWLAFLVRGLTPALNELIANMDPPNVPTEFGKDYPRQSDGSALGLGGVISTRLSRQTDQSALNLPLPAHRLAYDSPGFPPSAPRAIADSTGFPAPSPRAVSRETITMLAAVQTSRAQLIWLLSDVVANITNYPPSAYPVNALFLATDTDEIYIDTGAAWVLFPAAGGSQIITTPTCQLTFGGGSTGMTGTFTCSCIQTGKNVLLLILVEVTNLGSATGIATVLLGGIPVPAVAGTGAVSSVAGMLGLVSSIDCYIGVATTTVELFMTSATDSVPVMDTNFNGLSTPTFTLAIPYQSV